MPYYRQVLLVRKSASPNELSGLFKSIASIISNEQGVFHGIDHRGMKELGYPIVDRRGGQLFRHREARLMLSKFTSSTSALKVLESELKLNESIVRFETFKSRDPLRDFFTMKRDPEEQLKEHLAVIDDVPLSLQSKRQHRGVQPLEDLTPEEEKYENLGREFFKDDVREPQKEAKGKQDTTPHWKRDATYRVN